MNDLSDIKLVLNLSQPPLQKIQLGSALTPCTVDVLRTDLLHPVISGNKFYKLFYYLSDFTKGNYKGIVSFGGPFSNHLIATAAVCRQLNIPFTAVIRGEAPQTPGHTLLQLRQLNTALHFVSRDTFPSTHYNAVFWQNKFPDQYIIQAGGEGEKGIAGASLISNELNFNKYDQIFVAVGTGTTMAGLLKKINTTQFITGVLALKLPDPDNNTITDLLKQYSPHQSDFSLLNNYHFGGFGKSNDKLWQYMNDLYKRTGIPTDHVYTAKLFFAVEDLINKQQVNSDKKILIIHTGGLQGNLSLKKNVLIF